MDVNGDTNVTPLDVLQVINYINSHGSGPLPIPPPDPGGPPPFVDVSGDDRGAPLDVLLVINYINSHVGGASLPAPPAAPPPYYDVSDDGRVTPLDVLTVIDYINSHPLGSGEGEAIAQIASSPELEGLPPFDVFPTPLLAITPVQESGAGTAANNTHSWAAACQPLLSIRPEVAEVPSASPSATTAGRDMLFEREMRPPTAGGLDGVFAELDAVLPEIAENVSHGWDQVARNA